MTTINRTSGLRIDLPSSLQVVEAESQAMQPPSMRGRPDGRPTGPIALPNALATSNVTEDPVAKAFGTQEMQLVDAVELEPTPGPVRRGKTTSNTVQLNLDVTQNEDAVVLVEQDGFYAWNFPTSVQPTTSPRVRRGNAVDPGARQVVFRIELGSAAAVRPGGQSPNRQRGFIQDFVVGRVKAFVFKFAARIGVGAAMKFLERNLQTGFIVMDSLDPASWRHIEDLRALSLPRDRAARILLFIHGTFSSTRGSYGSLAATPLGHAFLQATWASYDAVIGYDHATLSETPLENAADLLARLERSSGHHAPSIDVVSYSRGGLVFRSLAEHLLPMTNWHGRIDRAVFVAVPNNGTRLAMSENWQMLVDLYTNLAVAITRAVMLIPQAQPGAVILREVIQGLAALVKYVVSYSTEERGVPGLASMVPGGEFITTINQAQSQQPSSEKTFYCAVTSEFTVHAFGSEPKEFAKRFLQALVDFNVDQLMGEVNDLVVNTASMTTIDLEASYFKDTLAIGATSLVYHTNYFIQATVIGALTHWLRLSEAQPSARVRLRPTARPPRTRTSLPGVTRARPSLRIPPDMVTLGAVIGPELPAAVDTSFFTINALSPASEATAGIERFRPNYVVVDRLYQDQHLYYAYSADEVFQKVRTVGDNVSVFEGLQMHEDEASQPRSITVSFELENRQQGPSSERGIVVDNGRPVGVLPSSRDRARQSASIWDQLDIRESTGGPLFGGITRGQIPSLGGITRGQIPSFGMGNQPMTLPRSGQLVTPSGTAPLVDEVSSMVCHFRAEMENQIVRGQVSTIEVTVSREELLAGTGRLSSTGSSNVTPDRKIVLQVIPKAQVENVDQNRIEIDPPEVGNAPTYYFDIRATHQGEGEVWVLVRQGQVPLVTLKLKFQIISARQPGSTMVSAQATTTEAPALPQLWHQLRITEFKRGNDTVYGFGLESQELGLFHAYESKPITGDRHHYVMGLYKKIEERWLSHQNDVDDFLAELQAFGGELLDELIPDELQKVLWENRTKIKSIQIIAEEPFIPWELVYLKQPGKPLSPKSCFLGQLGVVRWLHGAGWPPHQLRIRQGKARYVIPHYPHADYVLPEAQQEATFLEVEFGATPVEPQVGPVRTLLSQPGAFDLLHFACHGGAALDNISNAHLLMEGRLQGQKYIPAPLDATVVQQWSNFIGPDQLRPIVVLNACQAGRAGYRLTGIGGFAEAFLLSRAGAFIGTLWSVGDNPARSFTEAFYAELLKGATASEATIAAREAARAAGDATWLAYVVYAHPYAVLVPEEASLQG